MTIRQFIKQRPQLMWYIKDLDQVSEASIVEHVLNYGDWDDVEKMFKILTIKNTARIFRQQIKNQRNNYDPKIKNYFKLYFEKYA
ncbi:MAG: hypothetical protein V1765_03350 [bacterium]